MDETFGMRLAAAIAATGPLCAGIDPSGAVLREWGLTDDAPGLREATRRCVEAFAGVVAAVKPQVAFFERHGSAGMGVLEELVAEARQAGLLVIADAKRGDVANTAAAYADAWLGDGPFAADAVTAVAYVGLGALASMVDTAREKGRGLFVVVASSNPEGRTVQRAVTQGGRRVADELLAELRAGNEAETRALGVRLGSLGAVVGSTVDPPEGLSSLAGPVLAPGVGAQGAGPADVGRRFAGCPTGSVLPSSSRSLLALGPSVRALRDGALAQREELADALV